MRNVVLFTATLLALSLGRGSAEEGGETAYRALRMLASERGQDLMNRVVQVEGKAGIPQPESWLITVDDPQSRGGVRVFSISGGKIMSEHTPVQREEGTTAVMDFNRLNLDSAGAFEVADKHARAEQLGFDSLDYRLSASADGNPVWNLRLLGVGGEPLDEMTVAADSGQVLGTRRVSEGRQEQVTEVVTERTEDENILDRLGRFGRRASRHFQRDAASVENFFTGRRTLEPEEE